MAKHSGNDPTLTAGLTLGRDPAYFAGRRRGQNQDPWALAYRGGRHRREELLSTRHLSCHDSAH
jgi:hypothetical protein